jgi:hypothetical protein
MWRTVLVIEIKAGNHVQEILSDFGIVGKQERLIIGPSDLPLTEDDHLELVCLTPVRLNPDLGVEVVIRDLVELLFKVTPSEHRYSPFVRSTSSP